MLCDFYNEKLEFQENLIAKYYTKNGHVVTIVTSTYEDVFEYYSGVHDKNIQASTRFDGGVKIIKLKYKYNLLNKIRPFTSIIKVLEDESPDLIYVHDIMPNMVEAVAYIKSHPECKMIMDYHADYSNSGKNWISLKVLHGIIRKRYLDRSRKYISKIFPVVPAGIKFLHEIYKVPHSEMEVLPLGADVDLCHEIKKSKRPLELSEKYNIGKDSKVIVTGGKLAPRKKTEILIQAFIDLPFEDRHLFIIGDSSKEDADYKSMLESISRDVPNIHFTGWLAKDEVYTHYHIADIAVFPASQSILWQQAIAAELPLLVGNTGGQSIEYLNLYNNIIIMENDTINTQSITDNITQVLRNNDLSRSMKIGARKVALEQLDWNRLINRTLQFNK